MEFGEIHARAEIETVQETTRPTPMPESNRIV